MIHKAKTGQPEFQILKKEEKKRIFCSYGCEEAADKPQPS